MTSQGSDLSDGLSATASSLRAHVRYVSASDELTCPDSVINSAQDDEPVFVLRARDMVSTATIEWWLWCAQNRGVPQKKLEKAEKQGRAADLWIDKKLPAQTPTGSGKSVRTARAEREDPGSVLNTAHPDEPVFVIVASDVIATEVVEFWAFMAQRHGVSEHKINSAMDVARAMSRWTEKRVVGLGERPVDPTAPTPIVVNPFHPQSMRLVCMRCDHTEMVGTPPYDEEMLTAVRETCQGPCPSCGATPYTDENGRLVRVLTTT